MRVDVVKYLIMGAKNSRDLFFSRAQEAGIVEFISHTPSSLEPSAEIQTYVDALHVLRQMIPVKEEPNHDYVSAHVLAHHIVERSQELERLREKVRVTEKEIARIEVFGDFSLSDLHEIEQETQRVIQFFFCKRREGMEILQRPELINVGHAYGLDYYMSINRERTNYEGLIEIVFERSLGELREKLAHARREIDMYETELGTLAHKKKLLKQGLVNTLNRFNLEDSKNRTEDVLEGEAFAVEGWVPKNKVNDLRRLADELNLYITPIAAEREERIPTHLENKGAGRLGEDLIGIYDTPSISDRDPSLWVFIAFGLFFSMIIADAGYGLILLGLSLWLYFKYGKKQGGFMRRFTLISASLSIGCIIWGTLLLSFFGIDLGEDKVRDFSALNWVIEQKADYFLKEKPPSYKDLIAENPELKDASTPEQLLKTIKRKQEGMGDYVIYNTFQGNVLLEFAIFVGSIHIMLSFLRYLDKNWAGAGWVIFIVGAYLYFPSILGAVSLIHYLFHVPYAEGTLMGKYLIYGGLGLAVILALIQHRLKGMAEIMHVVQVFADVMSYLRLYALSLAGMIMAATFNNIAHSAPFILGLLIILVGHALNFILALMGGVIHGLRLNFIEWYHYSFEGGGKMFNPLSLINIETGEK